MPARIGTFAALKTRCSTRSSSMGVTGTICEVAAALLAHATAIPKQPLVNCARSAESALPN